MSAMRNLRKYQLWEEGGLFHVFNVEPENASTMGRGGFLHVCNAEPVEVSGVGRPLESDGDGHSLTQRATRAFVLQSELLTKTSAQAR